MIEGTYDHDSGWTFTTKRNHGRETWRVTWRSPDGKRGIIRAGMTVGEIEEADPEALWLSEGSDFRDRRAS